jgi:hypothetical protein
MSFSYADENTIIKSFLKPQVAIGWGISRVYFSNPSWNLLCRALIQAGLIPKLTELKIIQISDLSQISLGDITNLKHVGTHRVDQLVLELRQLDESISENYLYQKSRIDQLDTDPNLVEQSFFAKSLYEESEVEINKLTLETSLVIRMVKTENWRQEFIDEFGYSHEELEFEDENINRNLDIFAARLDGLTLDEIGKNYGVTRERIRQVIEKRLAKAEKYTSTIDFDLREKFELRLNDNKAAPKILEQQQRAKIEIEARKIIESFPGISWEELSIKLNVGKEVLPRLLDKNTKKFVFSEHRANNNKSEFTDEDILEALRLAEAFESPINRNLYDSLVSRGLIHAPGSQTVMHRFGTWNKACQLANVSYNESVRASYETLWEKEEILDYLIEFLKNRTYGEGVQSYDEWRIETLSNAPSGAHLRNIFDTWINAKNEALSKMLRDGISPGLI